MVDPGQFQFSGIAHNAFVLKIAIDRGGAYIEFLDCKIFEQNPFTSHLRIFLARLFDDISIIKTYIFEHIHKEQRA